MNLSFVLGNGKSRVGINLDSLRTHGKTYGCNALYRDFAPDVLIAVDAGITNEIEQNGYPLQHEFYTRKPNSKCGSRKITRNYGWSSGPIALSYAVADGASTIYLLGFDLGGSGSFNNVYSGTSNYKSPGSSATYAGNWIHQLKTVFKQAPKIQFIRVGTPNQNFKSANYSEISTTDFCAKFTSHARE